MSRQVGPLVIARVLVGGAVAKCVTGTLRAGRDVAVRVVPLAWDGGRQGRGPARSGTRVGVLITRRSQVQILPPLPKRQRQKARTTDPGLLLFRSLTCRFA